MYLFFDTETTGIPRDYKAPLSKLDNWPRLVQLAWLLQDDKGNELEAGSCVVKPVGFTIPMDAARIHGISTQRATAEGRMVGEVLVEFSALINRSMTLVAHNMAYDEKIVGAEFLRLGMAELIGPKKRLCTMQASTAYCALPGPYGYKWPKLDELHRKLFGQGFVGAHNAASDIRATAKCFWELRKRRLI